MVFNIHYIADTALYAKANRLENDPAKLGTIVSYQEGPDQTTEDELPLGCKFLAYPEVVNIWAPGLPIISMKVDTVKLQLVPIKAPLQPLNIPSGESLG